MLAEAILVHGEIGYKFCWLLPSEDWIRRHQLGTRINVWQLELAHPSLERLGRLRGMACLSGTECLSALSRLSSLTLFQKSILNHLKFKTKPILLIAQQSLICHKPNLFRRTYDFLVWWTITLDLQWRVSHYLKRLLLPNIKKGTKLPTYK